MSHPGHAIYKCPKCLATVRQCRCPAADKAVLYELCGECKTAIEKPNKKTADLK